MTTKSVFIFCTLILGSLAIPTPDFDETFEFFDPVDPSARVVGGTVTAAGSDPHMVAMTSGTILTSFLCGGSVIGARSVLTAAHCIEPNYGSGSLSRYLRVTVGTNTWRRGGQTFTLSGNATHPHYQKEPLLKNDIGILYTSTPMVYTQFIQPITMSFDFIEANVAVRAAGWGRTRRNGSISSDLRALVMATIDGQQCIEDVIQAGIDFKLRPPPVEPHIEICTKHEGGSGFGMCNGDSGSALTRVSDGSQVGVVSWGFPCARGAPDVFARVSAYEDWLVQNIRD